MQGSDSRTESTPGFAAVHHKPSDYLIETQNQDQRLGGGDGIQVRREASMSGHAVGSQGLCREDAD
jgi:hypothetical protein